MDYPPKVAEALKKANLIDANGQIVVVELRLPKNKPRRRVQKIEPATLQRLLAADTTPDHRWTDWLLFEAAGGEEAWNSAIKSFEGTMLRRLDFLINGGVIPQPDGTMKEHAPMPRDKAEILLNSKKDRYKTLFFYSDEDSTAHAHGFYTQWPGGPGERYAKLVDTLTNFLKVSDLLEKMNKELVRDGQDPLHSTPETIKSVPEMAKITEEVHRYFASKKARDDIRVETIYDDAYISAIAPLTYAAAVKYGWDDWAWANRQTFEQVLTSDAGWRDSWKKTTSSGQFYVYLTFKGPVPTWVSRSGQSFKRFDLTDLSLVIDKKNAQEIAAGDYSSVIVFDQENSSKRTLQDIRDMISAEPGRAANPDEDEDEDETPVQRGAAVYKTREEAEEVLAHLDKALDAVAKWVATFDTRRIKTDALKLDT